MWTADTPGWLAARLADASIVVANGTAEAAAALDGPPETEGQTVTLRATFREGDANFEWSERRVVVDGKTIDTARADMGRKVEGSVWTAVAELELPVD